VPTRQELAQLSKMTLAERLADIAYEADAWQKSYSLRELRQTLRNIVAKANGVAP